MAKIEIGNVLTCNYPQDGKGELVQRVGKVVKVGEAFVTIENVGKSDRKFTSMQLVKMVDIDCKAI